MKTPVRPVSNLCHTRMNLNWLCGLTGENDEGPPAAKDGQFYQITSHQPSRNPHGAQYHLLESVSVPDPRGCSRADVTICGRYRITTECRSPGLQADLSISSLFSVVQTVEDILVGHKIIIPLR